MALGLALLLTILFLPEGLGSLRTRLRRKRESHGAMSAILAVRDLEKTFGSLVAARDINVDVPRCRPSASSAPMARARPPSST